MIIDFHTHTFPAKVSSRIVSQLADLGGVAPYTDGSPDGLTASMQDAGIGLSVNLPVMTRPDQVRHVNMSLIEKREDLLKQGILTFGGLHPDMENVREEIRILRSHGIPGVKLHPAYQQRDINDPVFLHMIDALSDAGLITLMHAGLDIGFPGHNYASVKQILDVIRIVRPEKLVLAHMGGWQGWDDVENHLAGAPVYLDTGFALGPIPNLKDDPDSPYRENLSAERFVRLARKHGTDRILFATDSPWASQKDYVRRFSEITLTEDEKACIFGENAEKLLHLR